MCHRIPPWKWQASGIGAGLELSFLWVHGRYPGTPVVDDLLASHLTDGAWIGLAVQPQKAVNVSTASLLPFESILVCDGKNSLIHFVEGLESTSQVPGRELSMTFWEAFDVVADR